MDLTVQPNVRFNLVIEVLLVSSFTERAIISAIADSFQSRNRGSFGFKTETPTSPASQPALFQSRNRGSFGFKDNSAIVSKTDIKFQSRNRGSFGFK